MVDLTKSISLDNNVKLFFEKLPHTIRLAVSKSGEEWVCRKEKLTSLISFAEADKAHLFKGRLKLFKSADKIDVHVKNEVIGTVSTNIFKKVLNELK